MPGLILNALLWFDKEDQNLSRVGLQWRFACGCSVTTTELFWLVTSTAKGLKRRLMFSCKPALDDDCGGLLNWLK